MTVDFSRIYETINSAYHPYLHDFRGIQVFKGGASAGKSVFLAQRDVYRLLSYPGYNILIVRKVGATNRDSTLAEITKAISAYGLKDLFHVNKSRGSEEISCVNGNKIIFRGLDDPEKIKSITFETGPLIQIRIEEASEISEDDFNKLEIRLRGIAQYPLSMILSFNPIDKSHWLKSRFFDRGIKTNQGFICETTYKDNKWLTEEDKARLEKYKDIDYYYYMVYALNQGRSRDNTAVFANVVVEDFNIIEHHYDKIRHGMDYGFNDANTLCGFGWMDGELYIFREYYYNRKTNPEFIAEVEREGYPKDYPITGDSAHPDKIEEWNQAGYKVYPAEKGPGSLLKGINYLKSLPKIHIHESNCPNAAREFLNFKYRQTKDGRILDDFVELDDHTIAAARYASEDFFLDNVKPVFLRDVV